MIKRHDVLWVHPPASARHRCLPRRTPTAWPRWFRHAEQRAAIFGNLYPTQRYVQSVNALSPEQQAAIWGNVSPTHQYLNGVTALTPEQQAAIYGNVYETE